MLGTIISKHTAAMFVVVMGIIGITIGMIAIIGLGVMSSMPANPVMP